MMRHPADDFGDIPAAVLVAEAVYRGVDAADLLARFLPRRPLGTVEEVARVDAECGSQSQ